MERNDALLRGRLALEAAELAVDDLLRIERDELLLGLRAELVRVRSDLRQHCDRLEAVELDQAIHREREAAIG